MLTRKYYRMIANIIKDNTLKDNGKMLPSINKVNLITDLITELKRDNHLFNSSKFIDAYNFEFKESVESIALSLKNNLDKCIKFSRHEEIQYP